MKSDQNIYTKDIKLQHFYKFLWRIIPLFFLFFFESFLFEKCEIVISYFNIEANFEDTILSR